MHKQCVPGLSQSLDLGMRLVRLYVHAINHISLGYAGGGGGGRIHVENLVDGSISILGVSISTIPSIVHSVVVEGGNGVEYTPRSVLAWCYDGIRYYKPVTNAAA